jgi:DNA-binding LytR/AlgR family response regulator
MIRVFLLDDHEVVRRRLRELLTADGDIEIVGESGSALEATNDLGINCGGCWGLFIGLRRGRWPGPLRLG